VLLGAGLKRGRGAPIEMADKELARHPPAIGKGPNGASREAILVLLELSIPADSP